MLVTKIIQSRVAVCLGTGSLHVAALVVGKGRTVEQCRARAKTGHWEGETTDRYAVVQYTAGVLSDLRDPFVAWLSGRQPLVSKSVGHKRWRQMMDRWSDASAYRVLDSDANRFLPPWQIVVPEDETPGVAAFGNRAVEMPLSIRRSPDDALTIVGALADADGWLLLYFKDKNAFAGTVARPAGAVRVFLAGVSATPTLVMSELAKQVASMDDYLNRMSYWLKGGDKVYAKATALLPAGGGLVGRYA